MLKLVQRSIKVITGGTPVEKHSPTGSSLAPLMSLSWASELLVDKTYQFLNLVVFELVAQTEKLIHFCFSFPCR